MEYKRYKTSRKRRRKRYRTATRQRTQNSSSAPRAIFLLLLSGGIIYMLSASAIGTYLSENIIAPVFKSFKQHTMQANNQEGLKISLSSDKDSVTTNVSLPGITLYSLQMGVYASEENAITQGNILKSQSGAGYVFNDTDKYRVLSAGYENQDDAKAVKERLISEGMDCTLFTLSCDDSAFAISTDSENVEAVSKAFSSFKTTHTTLCNAILEFDKNTQTTAEGISVCSQILSDFQADMSILSNSSDIPPELESMVECYEKFCSELSTLTTAAYASENEFASAMKHAQLSMANTYINFSKKLSASV